MLPKQASFALRRYSPADAASVVSWSQSIDEARWWAGPQTRWPISTTVFQHWHSDPDVQPYILSSTTTPLGYGELWIDAAEREVELARLIVAPQQRRQGIGTALVGLLLAAARRTGYPRAFLRVFPNNHGAITCYRRAGFSPLPDVEQNVFNQGQPITYHWMSVELE